MQSVPYSNLINNYDWETGEKGVKDDDLSKQEVNLKFSNYLLTAYNVLF